MFQYGFSLISDNLSKRLYTSISEFSRDFGAVMSDAMNLPTAAGTEQPFTNGESPSKAATQDLKQKKALAKRILKAAQKPLEQAMSEESELRRKPVEQELKNLDNLLKNSISSRRDSMDELLTKTNGNVGDGDADADGDDDPEHPRNSLTNGEIDPAISELSHRLTNGVNGHDHYMTSTNGITHHGDIRDPPTPPLSAGGEAYSLSQGGVPWYMEAFSPKGTTISEEQWTGVRGMSEDLSDMDEDELSELVDAEEMKDGAASGKKSQRSSATTVDAAAKKKKAAMARKKRRSFR